jgi:hypothetical protein
MAPGCQGVDCRKKKMKKLTPEEIQAKADATRLANLKKRVAANEELSQANRTTLKTLESKQAARNKG